MNTKVNRFDGGIRTRGDRATETERGRDRDRDRERRKGKEEGSEKGSRGKKAKRKTVERKLVPPSGGNLRTRTLIAFKNREFAPATRKLSENLDSFHWNAFLYPGHRRDSNFSSPPRSHSSECTEETVQPDRVCMILYTYFLHTYICISALFDPRACK